MKYARLGDTGLIVSRLTLGTMTFAGEKPGAVSKTNEADAGKLVDAAIGAGINFLDTADMYSAGASEEVLGRIVKGRRDEVVIATKAGWRNGPALNQSGLSASHLHRSIDASLKRLGLDHVDVYIAHRDDANTPLEETLSALDAIVRAGKARYIGFSNWSAWKAAAALELQRANGWAPFSHGQMMYSLLGRGVEHEVIPMMRRYGLGLTVWSPLAGGFLSGKYTRENLKDPANRLSGFDAIPFDKEQGFALVDRLREIGEARGLTVAQVAIAWLLAKDAVTSVLVGASRLDQLENNLAAVDADLDAEAVAELDELTAIDPGYPTFVVNTADQPIADALAGRAAGSSANAQMPE